MVFDERLQRTAMVRSVRELTEARFQGITWVPVRASSDLRSVVEMSAAVGKSDLVISIGGGRTLDSVKLATALVAEPRLGDEIRANSLSGSLYYRGSIDSEVTTVAVATTLGTGAERSQSAVVDNDHGRVIVGSPGLRPSFAVLDALATRGLPKGLVMSGVFEAMCRAFGPATGQPRPGSTQDDLVLAVTHRLVSLGFALLDEADPGGDRFDGMTRRLPG